MPAVVVRFFKPELVNSLTLEDWGDRITELTSKFLEVEAWASVKQRILEHINFNISCNTVILPLQGEAGVGKTRLVYESLLSVEGAKNFVLYAIDEKSLDIAYPLVRDKSAKLILVADECLPQIQSELKNILNKVKDRVRVICIDNSGERIDRFTEQLWLERIPEEDVDSILKQNYSAVPADRRRAYVNLSRGFVKLAADLCSQDPQIAAQGNIGSVLRDVRSYLRNRLNDDEKLRIVEAISLFRKVGYRDELKEELDCLCEILKLDRDKILEVAQQLKDVPGFIAFAGRYLYITPEIIAQVSFEGAWKRWVEYDPPAFLDKIPNFLLDAFLNRVSTSGSKEVRRIVGEFFWNWTAKLQPIDLSDISKIDRFVVLAEINPNDYLPQLVRLIDRASKDELLKISGGYRGTRRPLVWLAERMAAFPEFFTYAESILWKLALAETEFNLANNATHIWQQLFCIFLSGTATPFAERITLLKQRLFTQNVEQITLALGALSAIFNDNRWHVVGSPVVAGRIPPEQWQPQTQLELRECIDLALAILARAVRSDTSSLKNGALNVAIQHLPNLLANGYLDQIKALFPANALPQDILVSLIRKVEDFLQFNSGDPEEVQEWLQSLIPNDFHGRLIQIVGKSPWDYSIRDNQETWQREIDSLAQQLCEEQELLQSEMEWLCSPQAMMVEALGNTMGAYDTNAVCLDTIMGSVADTQATGLARGYIRGLLENYPQQTTVINEWIDKFETQFPAIAYELSRAGGDATKAVERALKLVDKGTLSLEYLGGFLPGLLSLEEFYEILKRLVSSVKDGKNESATQTAIKMVAYRLQNDQRENRVSVLEDAAIQSLIWELLEATAQFLRAESYYWEIILRSAAKIDLDKAAKIASLTLVNTNSEQKEKAEQMLVDLAKQDPTLVMQRVGEVILDAEYGWHFEIEKYRFLIRKLPLDAMKKWLRSVGAVGAQRIARNLPQTTYSHGPCP